MQYKFYRKVLSNGMTVILEKRDLPVVSVAFAVRYGGINEALSERGIAHFIEHMLYKGTKNRTSKQISKQIEKNGGILNGFTDENLTAFWCKMPSSKLNIALNVLGDMVKNPLFAESDLIKERKVILEEMKLYRDTPAHYTFDKIQSFLYGGPLGTPLIGTPETLNFISRKKIISKFKEIYKTGNMILMAVGDADFENLVNFAEKNFNKSKSKIPHKKITIRDHIGTEKRKGIDQANLVFAFHAPKSNEKGVYAAKILMSLLANGSSSRLFQEIRDKRNLAYAVVGDVTSNKHFAYCYIYVGTQKEKVGAVKNIILSEFNKLSKDLKEQELSQTKEQVIGNYKISMEDSSEQLHKLLLSEVDGNIKEYYNFEENVRKVKLADVRKLAKLKKYSFFALLPD